MGIESWSDLVQRGIYVRPSGSGKALASVTRPNNTTAYEAGDVIANSATTGITVLTFASVVQDESKLIKILGGMLRIDVDAIPTGMDAFNVYLYSASPTAIADGAAYNLPAGDRDKYVGVLAFAKPVDLGATLVSQLVDVNLPVQLAADSKALYGVLQTVGAYTPAASTKFTVNIFAEQL